MKKIITLTIVIASLYLVGCATTLPDKSAINDSYSIKGVKTFSSTLNCENTMVTGLSPDFLQNYCTMLGGNIKLAIQKENRNIKNDEKNPELVVQTTLEEVNGGNAATRFWIGFGAGRSVTTVYVKVVKNGKIIAERRITETTTMPDIIDNNYENEDAILQDSPLISRRIGKFVKNPIDFEKKK